MKSKVLSIILMILSVGSLPLFAEEPPIKSNSGTFSFKDAITYNEQDGWAYIDGFGIVHYWLYDTYKNHNGDVTDIVDKYVPKWIEEMGYVINFDYIYRISPNKDLASSVKALMTQRGCDVSVAFVSGGIYPHVVINHYDRDEKIYWTDVIPVIKR